MLDDVKRRYPAHHYIMVDDKLRVLAACDPPDDPAECKTAIHLETRHHIEGFHS